MLDVIYPPIPSTTLLNALSPRLIRFPIRLFSFPLLSSPAWKVPPPASPVLTPAPSTSGRPPLLPLLMHDHITSRSWTNLAQIHPSVLHSLVPLGAGTLH